MAEYFVADSYKGYQLIGQPYRNKSGKMASMARCKCDRCTNGVYAVGVENGHLKPHPAFNGVCLKCGGSGYIEKEVRLYTQAEYDSMKRNNERTKQKKEEAAEAKRLAEFNTKKAKWLSDNGFNAEGNTFLYVKEDSYQKKDELKAAGYKYNPILKWHGPAASGFEEATEVHNVEEFYQLTAWGSYAMLSEAESKVKSIIEASRPASTSEWVGEIGKRLRDIPVTLLSMHGFEGRFGYSNVLKFVDENQNVYTWFTGAEIGIEVGESCFLSGSVKDHSEYKGEKTTILTRCRLT